MSENQHIYEDLNESSSARLGGSQQLEILASPNSKRAQTFPLKFWIGAEILEAQKFYQARRFQWRFFAGILGIRHNFHETQKFHVFVNVLSGC
jgi:hypothetical protein